MEFALVFTVMALAATATAVVWMVRDQLHKWNGGHHRDCGGPWQWTHTDPTEGYEYHCGKCGTHMTCYIHPSKTHEGLRHPLPKPDHRQ